MDAWERNTPKGLLRCQNTPSIGVLSHNRAENQVGDAAVERRLPRKTGQANARAPTYLAHLAGACPARKERGFFLLRSYVGRWPGNPSVACRPAATIYNSPTNRNGNCPVHEQPPAAERLWKTGSGGWEKDAGEEPARRTTTAKGCRGIRRTEWAPPGPRVCWRRGPGGRWSYSPLCLPRSISSRTRWPPLRPMFS